MKHLKRYPQINDRVTHLVLMPETSFLLQKLVIQLEVHVFYLYEETLPEIFIKISNFKKIRREQQFLSKMINCIEIFNEIM